MNRIPIVQTIFVMVLSSTVALSQGNFRVDVFTSVTRPAPLPGCEKLDLGSPIESITPVYPPEAKSNRVGGAVKVTAEIGTDGSVQNIKESTGPAEFQTASRDATLKTRFSVTRCDGTPMPVQALITFNFVPVELTDLYIVQKQIEDFPDVSPASPFYEAILTLTENYQLGFGYADGKYYADAPLLKGDFAHSLRLTLDLLQQRAEVARKIPREIDLYFPSNPHRVKTADSILDLDSRKPYAASVGFLVSKYDIALVDEELRFRGNLPMSQNSVIAHWKMIFGDDAVPVNFGALSDPDRVMSRGEFALFLQESLYVLTYKVLP